MQPQQQQQQQQPLLWCPFPRCHAVAAAAATSPPSAAPYGSVPAKRAPAVTACQPPVATHPLSRSITR
eukprot:scaffold273563_cov18-Tisochrysis_lutea.AAC.1